ncbi:hypothetical protein E2562_004117 [Oryza meyeriana var. granulata]|uniref:SKP1 component dimerisation domain-containing protein n=1 Tax=Oryza meyeriana var. granulata TaxID=110450 RepID=A0A6G1EV43_9ORYZ|nr:hypothetical protein E2562_004117 [Oryza meyeriana var. granulata]
MEAEKGEMAKVVDNQGEGETVAVVVEDKEEEGEKVVVAEDKEGEGETVLVAENKEEEGDTVKAAAEEGEMVVASDKGKGEAAVDNSGEEKASGEMISVVCSDGNDFKIPVVAAMLSTVLRDSIDSDSDHSGLIKVPHQVPSKIFPMVKVYCTKHAKVDDKGNSTVSTNSGAASSSSGPAPNPAATEEEDLKNWDKEFVNVDQWTLYGLLLAAHFLNIDGLFDITCHKVANMLKGKNCQQMREILNIVSDFTKDDEKAIKAQNPWAFTE